MRNIWTGKKQKSGISPVTVIFILAAAAFLVIGTMRSRDAGSAYRLQSMKESISRAAALCYAAEGSYPSSLDYLCDNYGISIDTDRYTVHYSYAGGNIPPDIIVTEKKSS